MNRSFFVMRRMSACCAVVSGLLTVGGCHSHAVAGSSTPGTAATASDSGGAAQISPAGVSRVLYSGAKRVSVVDPQREMSAATLEIPSDWKFAGRIVSAPGCHGVPDAMVFTAEAQDGVTAIVRMPGVRWTVTPANNIISQNQAKKCAPVDVTTAAGFLKNLAVPNMHPGATIEAELPLLPEGQAALTKQLAQMQQQFAKLPAAFGPKDVTLDGARVRITYVRNGQPVEEMLTAVVTCNTSQMLGKTCTSRGTTVARAPKGKLDALLGKPEITNLGNSVQWNPQWMERKNQEQQAINQHNLDANHAQFEQNLHANQQQFEQMMANGRAQTAARTQQFNNAMAADRAHQDAIDAAAHGEVNYSLDRKDYINPNTGQTVTASNQYNHQWINSSSDTLVQTNSPSYDPNGIVDPIRESWTELVPK